MRHLFLAAAMMVGALVVTFGAASTLQSLALSRPYASASNTPAMIMPVAKATETLRARLHVSPRETTAIDQVAETKL
jgi:hypothetical protein